MGYSSKGARSSFTVMSIWDPECRLNEGKVGNYVRHGHCRALPQGTLLELSPLTCLSLEVTIPCGFKRKCSSFHKS